MTLWVGCVNSGPVQRKRRFAGGTEFTHPTGDSAKSRSLDVALIEVIRMEDDVEVHRQITDYATWIRQQAASIE
jgi:hypothetical protein